MSTFRLRRVGGDERVVRAARVVTDGASVRFEDDVRGRWREVLSAPAHLVERVQRRDADAGEWVDVRPQPMVSDRGYV